MQEINHEDLQDEKQKIKYFLDKVIDNGISAKDLFQSSYNVTYFMGGEDAAKEFLKYGLDINIGTVLCDVRTQVLQNKLQLSC